VEKTFGEAESGASRRAPVFIDGSSKKK
jgi:hypothetical protein